MDPSSIRRGNFLAAVSLGTLFVNLGGYWLAGTGPSWPLAPVGLGYAVSMALWGTWVVRTRQGTLWKVWTGVVPALGVFLALSLGDGLSVAEALGRYHNGVLGFLVCLFQGLFAAFWASQTAGRARLSQALRGAVEGRDLEDRAREVSEAEDYTRENHRRLGAVLGLLGGVALVLASLSPYGPGGLTPGLLGGFLAVCLLVWVQLQGWRREREALTWGHRFTRDESLFPFPWVLVLGAAAAAGSGVLTSLVGPLDFWSPDTWAGTIPNGLNLVPGGRSPAAGSPTGLVGFLNGIALFLSSLFVDYMLLAFGLVALALAAFLVWPLVRQLLSGGWVGWADRWKAAVLGQVRWLVGVFLALVRWRPGKKRIPDGEPVSGARAWLRSVFEAPGKTGRQPFAELVEGFLKLVKWAEPVAVYRVGETTRAYLNRLAALLPDRAEDLGTLRDMLDQELFGPEGLDRRQRGQFLRLIRGLVSVRSL